MTKPAGNAGASTDGSTCAPAPVTAGAASPGARLRDRVGRAPSSIHGLGCFARIAFRAGDWIGTYEGTPTTRDGTYVLWVGDDQGNWSGRSGSNLLRWLNHSDQPNTVFDGFQLYALRDIASGEELTFDYGGGTAAGADC
ncbi:MAG: SET domain-containing protein-lysine N-methyltransferase [Chromatiaceae bacterium]|nr:MAG: SET domain-containing protein-lysine N-methyltransferase [Chromatiaceae bacterium]